MMKLNPAATITEEFAERIKSENRSAKMMKLAPFIVLACLVVVFLIVCGASFLSPKNIMNILNQMALPLVVALGLTFVIMLGSIDLSIDGSVGMAGSLFACFVLNSEFAYDLGFLSVVIAVGVSMLCGLLIGLCHVYLKIPSFMASFAFMYICKGIGMVSYQGHPPTIKDPVITALPTTTFLGIPFITWVAIVMFLLCFFILLQNQITALLTDIKCCNYKRNNSPYYIYKEHSLSETDTFCYIQHLIPSVFSFFHSFYSPILNCT